MSTIAEKLTLLADTKAKIKASIEAKGVTVGNVPFADYPAKIAQISGGGDFSDVESLAVVVHVHNRSTSVSFSCDDALLGGNGVIAPGGIGTWFYESVPEVFDILMEGSITKVNSVKCYVRNGDFASTTQYFSELGGDVFNLWWDQQRPLDLKQKIEIYLFDY